MARELIRLPFLEGLERSSGAFITSPTSFRDLRDVHVQAGAMRFRRGLETKATIAGATDILAIHPMRGAQQSVVVAYDSGSRDVTLYRVTVDPTTLGLALTAAGALYTLPVAAPFPRVVVTDSFGLAFVAHDEQNVGLRQRTKVYDPSSGLISDLLFNNDAAVPMALRGVRRWLTYIVGWGYGRNVLGPPDERYRPEILRLSQPGDPTRFPQEYYFVVGQRGEPIVAGDGIPAGFVIAKEGELYLLTGTSQLDLDYRLIDPYFGAVSQSACVAVGNGFYFWSAEGPRVTFGEESASIGDALDLRGEVPDSVLAATDYRYTFTVYRPETDEIEWVFPASGLQASWSYVYHRATGSGTPLWHYNKYGAVLRSAGVLAGNINNTVVDPANAPYPTLTAFSLNSGGWYRHTVSWQNNNNAFLPAGAVAELWVCGGAGAFQQSTELPWRKAAEVLVAGATQNKADLDIGTAADGQEYRSVAIRYRLTDGSYYDASQSASPMDWPASSRATLLAPARPELAITAIAWDGVQDYTSPIRVTWSNTGLANLDTGTVVEVWTAGADSLGGDPIAPDVWTKEAEVSASGASQNVPGIIIGQQARHIALRYRIGGAYYAHSQDPDPYNWPAASVAALLLDGPRPYLSFAWDIVNGIPRSPGTLTITMPDATLAPAGTWTLELLRTVWYDGIGYAIDAIPPSAWAPATGPGPWSPRPPLTAQVMDISSLNASFRVLYAARLRLNGTARPASYSSSDPLLWPAISRLTLPVL